MNFIALDVETANPNMASICAVGLCRFEAGQLAGHMHFLVDPEDYFDPLNVSIHGITPGDVAGAPTMKAVLPLMAKALAGNVVVHHTHFDRVAVHRAAAKAGLAEIGCRWLDSAMVARRAWEHVAYSGYGLRSLADAFNIEFEHHDAREDARAAGLILLRAMADSGLDLEGWISRVQEPIDLERAAKWRAKLSGDPTGHMAGETIVFTGRLQLPRIEASELAACAGCNVDPGVTKQTTILVVGDQDIRVVGVSGKSSKHRKAEKMIADGTALRIIGESDFKILVAVR